MSYIRVGDGRWRPEDTRRSCDTAQCIIGVGICAALFVTTALPGAPSHPCSSGPPATPEKMIS